MNLFVSCVYVHVSVRERGVGSMCVMSMCVYSFIYTFTNERERNRYTDIRTDK